MGKQGVGIMYLISSHVYCLISMSRRSWLLCTWTLSCGVSTPRSLGFFKTMITGFQMQVSQERKWWLSGNHKVFVTLAWSNSFTVLSSGNSYKVISKFKEKGNRSHFSMHINFLQEEAEMLLWPFSEKHNLPQSLWSQQWSLFHVHSMLTTSWRNPKYLITLKHIGVD